MVSTTTELKDDVRQFTGYTSTMVLSNDGLDTAYRTAKRHIRVQKAIRPDYDWYDEEVPEAQEALFWWTCLFAKVETGELDSQGLQAGAVNQKSLLAKENDDVTTWYRNAKSAMETLQASNIIMSSSPGRTDREYTADGFEEQSGGSSSTSVDNTDI